MNKTNTRKNSRLSKVLNVEWIGQTIASLCWIASVFFYGISSVGDWLQLIAASCWLAANIAAIVTYQSHSMMNKEADIAQ